MSARTYMISVKSLEPIKNAIGSQDRELLNALHKALEDNDDFKEYAENMIMNPRPAKEPGCWSCFVEPMAEHLGLEPNRLPLEDWKHYPVWKAYLPLVNPLISPASQALLKLLESGRPFHGSEIDHDGCMFAWLTPEEVATLLADLSKIDEEQVESFGEVDEFHEEIVQSLEETVERQHAVFFGAS